MGVTTDRNDPGLEAVDPASGLQAAYLILSAEERAKGFVRPLRDLTPEERDRYAKLYGYIKYENYENYEGRGDGALGRFWSQAQLDSGCGSVTSMGRELAETYARQPDFYGGTYCATCLRHLPVAEFIWLGTEDRVGS